MLLQLQNESSLPIKFWVRLESLSKKKAETYQQLPKFLTSQEQRTEIVGELTDALPGTTGIYSSTGRSVLGHEGGVWGGVGQDRLWRGWARREVKGSELSGGEW